MTNGREFDKPATYQIVVQGSLEHKWSDWFDGLAIQPRPDDETALTGLVPDQAALHGILLNLHNLGLPLLRVNRTETD